MQFPFFKDKYTKLQYLTSGDFLTYHDSILQTKLFTQG